MQQCEFIVYEYRINMIWTIQFAQTKKNIYPYYMEEMAINSAFMLTECRVWKENANKEWVSEKNILCTFLA